MMTLVMLPFLLAIGTSMSDDGLQEVPVYTYTAQLNCYHLNLATNLKRKSLHMRSTLTCYPRVPTIFNCRVDNVLLGLHDHELLDPGLHSMGTWELDTEPFEIHFDRNGVVMVHMDNSRPTWLTGIIKPIVDQLNIGFDLRSQPYCGTFVTKEKSYIGNCHTLITMNQRLSLMEHAWPDTSAYAIILVRNKENESDEELQIVKERNLKHCSIDYDPVTRRKTADSMIYTNIPMRMTSSMTNIVISDSNYTAHTVNDLIGKNPTTGEIVQIFEEITLVLDSVSTKSIESSQNYRLEEMLPNLQDELYGDPDAMAQAP